MSDILESSAVITVKKTFKQFANFYGFWFYGSAKNAAGGVSIYLNKLCQSNIN